MDNIFITGGCGFIGVNLARYLLNKHDCRITAYDNLSVGSSENLESAISGFRGKDKVRFIKADILDREGLEGAVRGHDVIIHLAAHTNVVESMKDPQRSFDINVTGTFNLLEAARKEGIRRFVFASSNAAVGEVTPPISEENEPHPVSVYGVTKLTGERLCRIYHRCYGIETVSLRFANVYGPYSHHKTSVVALYLKWAGEGKPLVIYGDGKQTRDFIHVNDICSAIYLCLNGRDIGGEVFQIATENETRIIDLAGLINDTSGKRLPIDYRGQRNGEIRRNYSSIAKAKAGLGFKPNTDLREGLKNLWKNQK